jgi:hypothetical protein
VLTSLEASPYMEPRMMWRVTYQTVLGGKVAAGGCLMRVPDFNFRTDMELQVEGIPGRRTLTTWYSPS